MPVALGLIGLQANLCFT